METLASLTLGLSTELTPVNLGKCLWSAPREADSVTTGN